MIPVRLGENLYLRDRARGVRGSAISGLSESLAISGTKSSILFLSRRGVWENISFVWTERSEGQ